MTPTPGPPSIPDVCESLTVSSPGAAAGARPDLLIEAPHGATTRHHYEALRRCLRGPLPDDLQDFFFVNTDVGSFEAARMTAELVADPASSPSLGELLGDRLPAVRALPPRTVLILRCLIPRTFIDCNRAIAEGPAHEGEMTPAVPGYIGDDRDATLLKALHGRYQEAAAAGFDLVCGAGGPAVVLHTYAPRSVSVDRIDGSIVETLRRAYAPERYRTWPRRPDVDVITELSDGTRTAPDALVGELEALYGEVGIEMAENATYRLHPATLGHVHSVRYPGRVLCMEISRACLADPFSPFEEMRIGEEKTERMATPLAAALLSSMATRR